MAPFAAQHRPAHTYPTGHFNTLLNTVMYSDRMCGTFQNEIRIPGQKLNTLHTKVTHSDSSSSANVLVSTNSCFHKIG